MVRIRIAMGGYAGKSNRLTLRSPAGLAQRVYVIREDPVLSASASSTLLPHHPASGEDISQQGSLRMCIGARPQGKSPGAGGAVKMDRRDVPGLLLCAPGSGLFVCRFGNSSEISRQQFEQELADCIRPVLSRCNVQRVGTLEPGGAFDLQIPVLAGASPKDRDSPIPVPVAEHVFDHRNDLGACHRIAGVLQLDRYGHTSCHCTKPRHAHP
jgi:hypothetical protein